MLCCVVNMGAASRVVKAAKKQGVQGATISIGRGTVCNRLLEFLRLDEERKEIVFMVVESQLASDALKAIGQELKFHKPNHGIGFSIPVLQFIGHRNIVEKNAGVSEMKDAKYQIIYVVVDRGMAEEVVAAARKSGARGGTIINARGAGIHEVQKVFSIEIEPEKEEVFIIVRSDIKDDVVNSIRTHMKIDDPGTGILFVMNLNEVYGIHDE